MNNLYERILQADSGDAQAQFDVAWYIVWRDPKEVIEPDWLERALDYYQRAAEQGIGDALLDLGNMYVSGRGVEMDREMALHYYQKAADILHPKAFRCLGYWAGLPFSTGYLDPVVPGLDYRKVFAYLLKGALLDEQNSLYEIGDLYFSGKYVELDQGFAYKLYEKSYDLIDNELDDSFANVCLRLGECYLRGIGCDKDVDNAQFFLQRALRGFGLRLERGDPEEAFMGEYNRTVFLQKRLETNPLVEHEAVVKQHEVPGYEDFLASSSMDFPMPETPIPMLEQLKTENPAIFVDEGLYFADTLRAAQEGDSTAMYQIGFYCLSRFEDSPENKQIISFALYYYHKAIRTGCRVALHYLADVYKHGNVAIKANPALAVQMYTYSNVILSQNELGAFFANGKIVPRNYERAFKHFAKDALSASPLRHLSLWNLSTMYEKGIFVQEDKLFADYLLKMSKEIEKEAESWEYDYEKAR